VSDPLLNIRRITPTDAETIRELWTEFEEELPEPEGFRPDTWEEAWRELSTEVGYLAEDDSGTVAFASAAQPEHGRSHITIVHVRPRARGKGIAKALVRALVTEVGAEWISLEVLSTNADAQAVWLRLGFREVEKTMAARADELRLD
jgi:ribosomal protein S18 acetylase RimI-like enzyme